MTQNLDSVSPKKTIKINNYSSGPNQLGGGTKLDSIKTPFHLFPLFFFHLSASSSSLCWSVCSSCKILMEFQYLLIRFLRLCWKICDFVGINQKSIFLSTFCTCVSQTEHQYIYLHFYTFILDFFITGKQTINCKCIFFICRTWTIGWHIDYMSFEWHEKIPFSLLYILSQDESVSVFYWSESQAALRLFLFMDLTKFLRTFDCVFLSHWYHSPMQPLQPWSSCPVWTVLYTLLFVFVCLVKSPPSMPPDARLHQKFALGTKPEWISFIRLTLWADIIQANSAIGSVKCSHFGCEMYFHLRRMRSLLAGRKQADPGGGLGGVRRTWIQGRS